MPRRADTYVPRVRAASRSRLTRQAGHGRCAQRWLRPSRDRRKPHRVHPNVDGGSDDNLELDDYARDAYAAYVDAADAIEAAEQRRDKAKQALVTFMTMSDADAAELDGVPVLTLSNVNGVRFDVKRFETAAPFKYREYLKTYRIRGCRGSERGLMWPYVTPSATGTPGGRAVSGMRGAHLQARRHHRRHRLLRRAAHL